MDKLIIKNRTEMSMVSIMKYVYDVVKGGKISNYGKQYCYLTAFPDEIYVSSDKNKKSDRLIITKRRIK